MDSNEMVTFTSERPPPTKTLSNSFVNLRKKNGFMKIAIIVMMVIIVALICAILIVLLSITNDSKNVNHIDSSTCKSEACIQTAKYLYENMDLTVDPCEDFYNYTCRGWGVHNPRQGGTGYWGVNAVVGYKLKKQIMEILESKKSDVPMSLKKAKSFYASCTNTEFRQEYGREAIMKIFKKIGGFPMISKGWKNDEFDWQKAYIYIDVHLNSVNLLFDYKVDRQEVEDKTRFIELRVQKNFYIGSTLIDDDYTPEYKLKEESEFRETVKKRLSELKTNVDWESNGNDLNEMIEFEKKLAKIAKESSVEDNENDATKLTISEMKQQYPNIDWKELFSNMFKIVNISITENETIYNSNPTYFRKLGNVLNETSKRTIANYMGYTVLDEFGKKAINNYMIRDDDTIDVQELRETCTTVTEKFFRVAINYWYMKTVLGEDAMNELNDFLHQIKAALTLTINTNEWMNDQSRQEAQLKLNKMLDFIGSPSSIKSDDELNQFYRNTGFVSSENYVHAFKTMSKWIKYDKLKSLRDIEDKKVAKPSEVNAYYSPYDNKIQILIGFLSPPNFYPNAPIAVNVAAIGSTISHEVTHGFDNEGAEFNWKGIKTNWWDTKTRKRYESKVTCFKKQYSAFVEPKTGLYVDGNKTIGENIADNGAIHQTFTAYKMYAALKHPEKDLKLPLAMSRFTTDQLFFIAYANTYCNDHTRSWLKYMISRDEHPPDVTRVIIPLQNSKEFAKAFQCKLGSRMNPEKKCFLW